MIDEKKLIEELLHNDGVNFVVNLQGFTPEELCNCFQEFTDKMKEGFINLINAQPKIHPCVALAKDEEKWISAKEKLPKPYESVLIHVPELSPLPTVRDGYLCEDEYFEDGYWFSLLSHKIFTMHEVPCWMPFPEPPKGGEG